MEGGGKDREQERRRKGAREGSLKKKIDGKEGGSSPGLGLLLGSVWQIPHRPKYTARPTPQLAPGLASRPRAGKGRSLPRSHTWPGGKGRDSELAWEHHGGVG